MSETLDIFLLLFGLKVQEFSPKTSDTVHLLTSNLTKVSLDYFKGLSPCNEVMQFSFSDRFFQGKTEVRDLSFPPNNVYLFAKRCLKSPKTALGHQWWHWNDVLTNMRIQRFNLSAQLKSRPNLIKGVKSLLSYQDGYFWFRFFLYQNRHLKYRMCYSARMMQNFNYRIHVF